MENDSRFFQVRIQKRKERERGNEKGENKKERERQNEIIKRKKSFNKRGR